MGGCFPEAERFELEHSNESAAFGLPLATRLGNGLSDRQYIHQNHQNYVPMSMSNLTSPTAFPAQHPQQAIFNATVHHYPPQSHYNPVQPSLPDLRPNNMQAVRPESVVTRTAPLPNSRPLTAGVKKAHGSKRLGARSMISHSAVEKQRRDRINSLIDEIRDVVPSSIPSSQRPKHVVLEDALEFIKAVLSGSSSSQGSPLSSHCPLHANGQFC